MLDTQEKFVEAIKNINGTYFTNDATHYDFKTPVDPALKEQLEWLLPLYSNGFGNGGLFREGYILGDLGKVYGHQWRNQNGVDQVKEVLDGLKTNPYSRYHIIDGWNKADFKDMALPPCHLLYQFIVRPLSLKERIKIGNYDYDFVDDCMNDDEKGIDTDFEVLCNRYNIPKFYLDLNMYQRSADACCGIPFNLASMSLLLMIVSNTVNMIPGISTWIGGDSHIYVPHIDEARKQIQRQSYKLPKLQINKKLNSLEDIEKLTVDDFILSEYNSHPSIKYDLFVGLKKENIESKT